MTIEAYTGSIVSCSNQTITGGGGGGSIKTRVYNLER